MSGGVRRWVAILAGTSVMGVLAAAPWQAHAQTPLLYNGDFEAGLSGWLVDDDATALVDTSTPGPDGANAAHVAAAISSGTFFIESQWWRSGPVVAGALYRAGAWFSTEDARVTSVEVRIDFVDASGGLLGSVSETAGTSGAAGFFQVVVAGKAPAGASRASVVLLGVANEPGATFDVDGVSLALVGDAPTVTPTLPPSPTSTASPTATSTSTGPTPMATLTVTATATLSPSAPGPTLRNASFADGAREWEVRGGEVSVEGSRLVLRASGGSTAWVQQLVLVDGAAWYEASARLAAVREVGAGWVRIAWYASRDGSGSQMSTADSPAVGTPGDGRQAQSLEDMSTGAVRAPAGAQSARVRVLLRPEGAEAAELIIDDVAFGPTSAPTPTASPTPTPAVASAAPPIATSAAGTPSAGGGVPAASPLPATAGESAAVSPAATSAPGASQDVLDAQSWIRITEVMADPAATGRDADFEWVELTNTGRRAVSMVGMVLRDQAGETALPSMVVPPGVSVVVAGPSAEVDADVRLDGPIGNGLGNDGDRLALIDAAGITVDEVAYGTGTDLLAAAGESVQRWFREDGELLGAGTGAPTPGEHVALDDSEQTEDVSVARGSEEEAVEGSTADVSSGQGGSGDALGWMLLLAIGGGAVGGATMQRLGSRRRSRAD